MKSHNMINKRFSPIIKIPKILIVLIIFASGIGILSVREVITQRYTQNPKVSEFFLCKGRDEASGGPTKPVHLLTADKEMPIFACGYLDNDRQAMGLVYLYKIESGKEIFVYDHASDINPGYFYVQLPDTLSSRPSTYRVIYQAYHDTIASFEFRVK